MCFCLLALFAIGMFLAKPLLSFIGKGKLDEIELATTLPYFQWQLAGLLIMSALYPLSTYLGARADLKKMTQSIFLPWIAGSSLIYFFAANKGALVTAKSNVAYALLNLLFYAYYLRYKGKAAV